MKRAWKACLIPLPDAFPLSPASHVMLTQVSLPASPFISTSGSPSLLIMHPFRSTLLPPYSSYRIQHCLKLRSHKLFLSLECCFRQFYWQWRLQCRNNHQPSRVYIVSIVLKHKHAFDSTLFSFLSEPTLLSASDYSRTPFHSLIAPRNLISNSYSCILHP